MAAGRDSRRSAGGNPKVKIVMLTESLGSGGAERQVCTLAGEFKRRGHEVRVATYADGDFYKSFLEDNEVPYDFLGGSGKREWGLRIRRYLRKSQADVALTAHLSTAGYAELAAFPEKPWGLVVREGLTVPSGRMRLLSFRRLMHAIADRVITNSYENRIRVVKTGPWLKSKTIVVYNAVDLNKFRPFASCADSTGPFRLLVVARRDRQKNVLGAIGAVSLLREAGIKVVLDWFGNGGSDTAFGIAVQDALKKKSLGDAFRFHPASLDLTNVYQQTDAILLASFYEGLPNAICEGMACGKPILASRVGDAERLVVDGRNGFLFDPHAPSSIAGAISYCANLSANERREMGMKSRELAEKYFKIDKVADKYEEVLTAAAMHARGHIEDWPAIGFEKH